MANKPQGKMLNEKQHHLIIGSLLGDGHLRRKKETHNSYLSIKRCLSDLDYLKEEYNILKDLCSSGIKQRSTFDKRTNKVYSSCEFSSKSLIDLNSYYNIWYKNKIKVVPNNLELNDLSIAIWFFDDGNLAYKNNRFYGSFATNSFTKDEVYYLKSLLDNRYNVKFVLTNKIKDQYIIKGSDHQFRPLLSDIDKFSYFLPRKSNIWKNNLNLVANTKSNICIDKSILIIEEMLRLKQFSRKEIADNLNLYFMSKKGKQVDKTLINKLNQLVKLNYICKKDNYYIINNLEIKLKELLDKKKYY